MISLGNTARQLREKLGLTQREAAEVLGISNVHLCNVENDKSEPSTELLDRYLQLWGVDLHVLAWCESSDLSRLPKAMRAAAAELSDLWAEEIEHAVAKWKKTAARQD
jgi:transcriptional regulator with XRE-family HTH domain